MYEIRIPRTTGTASASWFAPFGAPTAATRPATTGAKITDAPIVAIQPPRTAPQDVAAGRTTTPLSTMTVSLLSMDREARHGVHARRAPDAGKADC